MLKIAYQKGLAQALEEAGMDKKAFLGALGTVGRGILGAGKGAWKGLSKITPGGGDTLGFGLFGGGMGALSAEPGSRLEGFGKGLGTGLIGGVGWHYGTRGATKLMGSLAKSKTLGSKTPGLAGRMQKVLGIGSKANTKAGPLSFRDIWRNQGKNTAETAKMYGAKSLVAVPTLGGAFALSGAAEDAAGKYIPALRHKDTGGYEDIPKYVSVARDVLRAPRMGLTPPGVSSGAFPGVSSGAQSW